MVCRGTYYFFAQNQFHKNPYVKRNAEGINLFEIKKACKDCPFRKGSSTDQTLAPGRVKGIVEDLYRDMSFHCHKTLDETNQIHNDSKFCRGSLLYMEREGVKNQMMQVGFRLGLYDGRMPETEDGLIDVIPDVEKGWYGRYVPIKNEEGVDI
jgi:hypothetical protein